MYKHLIISLFAYAIFGIGQTYGFVGSKYGADPDTVLWVRLFSLTVFVVVIFTSLQKVKDFIKLHDCQMLNSDKNDKVSDTTTAASSNKAG